MTTAFAQVVAGDKVVANIDAQLLWILAALGALALRKSRQAEEEREARMKFLTAPDTGIRQFVAAETARKNCAQAFTVDELATSLTAPQSEIEEALRILRSRGFAHETSIAGNWFIKT